MKHILQFINVNRRQLRFGILLCLAMTCAPASHAFPSFKDNTAPAIENNNDEPDRLEVSVKDGYIYVSVTKNTVVRLYSILGQLVSQQNISAGTTRFKAPARGVYILSAGPVTKRVTVN